MDTVSIIILNYNCREFLDACLTSVFRLEYPRDKVEVIVVDNASSDGSADWLRDKYPQVRCVANPENVGFARGIQRGAAVASGKYLAFLNQDMRVDAQWLAALVSTIQSEPGVACAGSIVLNWTGEKIDYAGRSQDALNLFPAESVSANSLRSSIQDEPFLFASGGAMLIRREIFQETGGFDPDYFLYHEDVDLGWRLWSRGYRVLRSTRSIVYHKPGSSAALLPPATVAYWAQKHALYTALKNLENTEVQQVLPRLLYFLIRRANFWEFWHASFPKALHELVHEADSLWLKRSALKSARTRPDAEIFSECGHPFETLLQDPTSAAFQQYWEELGEPISLVDGTGLANSLTRLGFHAYQFNTESLSARLIAQEQKTNGLVDQFAERQQAVNELAAQLAERRQAVQILVGQIAGKDQALQDRSAELAQKNDQIAALSVELLEHTRTAQDLATRTLEHAEEIRNLNHTLNTIFGSKLWKIGTLYRRVFEGTLEFLRLRKPRGYEEPAHEPALPVPGAGLSLIDPSTANARASIEGTRLIDQDISSKADVFCFPIIDWNFRFQRPQQLLTLFAHDGHRVFYLRCTFSGLERLTLDARSVSDHICELTLPGEATTIIYRDDLTNPTLGKAMNALCAFIDGHGVAEALCLVQHPFWSPLAQRLKEQYGWKIVYDCMDDHSGFQLTHPEIAAREQQLVTTSDLVVASSRLIYDRMRQKHPNCILVPNAGDYAHFSQLPQRAASPLSHLQRPVIGYYGAIAEWFDVPAIRHAAERHPQWSFALIGHAFGADLERLGGLPNVHLLGEKPYDKLPAYIAGMDVCTIPFLKNALTESTNPVKVYEYLGAGKPVVERRLPDLEPLADVVHLYTTPDEFVNKLEGALRDTTPTAYNRRQAIARANTWEDRYAVLAARVKALYGKVSIIIVTWNNIELTRQCVDSVLRDETWCSYELIIVDNASSDGTIEYLQALADKETRVKLVLNAENQGFAAANNAGLRVASDSEFVVLLNNDTVVPRGWLARLLRHVRKPDVGMVGPVTNWSGNESMIPVTYHDMGDMEAFALVRSAEHAGEVTDLNTLAMFCVAMRRTVVHQIGPLDERFGVGMFEDDDYAHRVRQAGYRVICAEDVFVHHQGSASFSKLSEAEYRNLFESNKRRYEEKWGEPWVAHQSRDQSPNAPEGAANSTGTSNSNGSGQPLPQSPAVPAPKIGYLNYRCNICGQLCESRLTELGRETPSCSGCGSTVRMRVIIHLLSMELFGKIIALPDFPTRRDIQGMGLSDWDRYAIPLAQKLNYTNTFYHQEPRLDITAISSQLEGTLDFLISTDVFEHIAPPVSTAFVNARKLLKPNGVLIFTVPYSKEGETREHFPELCRYEIVQRDGKPVLKNITRDGRPQIFEDLIFHGGAGATLEMRLFSESSLLHEFAKAGFKRVQIHPDPYFEYGIYWNHDGSLPIVARVE
jgi:GT2 family glycosyltransferase/glycosyltransferase involved in cell wall biosynthesis